MHKIVYGLTGQFLRHVPLGVPSDATFELEDVDRSVPDPLRVIASGPSTAATWTLTSSAVAGRTQASGKRIPTASDTAGISIGDPAVIVAPDGTRELFEVAAISAGSYVEAASSLAGVYPTGSTVACVLLEASVPDAFAANLDRFKHQHALRITWTYTLDGVARRLPEFVTFVRSSGGADELVGEALLWLSKAYPDARDRLGDDGQLDAMARLMADDVADDLRQRGIDPETFLIGSRGRALLVCRILAHLAEHGWAPGGSRPEVYAPLAAQRYQTKLEFVSNGLPGKATAETSVTEDVASGMPSRESRALSWES